jgi:hypothetical protein
VFSTWGIQSYPQFVQRKWKTLKKTEFRSSTALKTRVEFSIPGAEFGCFDTAISFRAPVTQTCACGAPQAVEGMRAREKNPRSMLISLSFVPLCCGLWALRFRLSDSPFSPFSTGFSTSISWAYGSFQRFPQYSAWNSPIGWWNESY